MSYWGKIFAAGYDRFMAGTERAGLSAHRQALLAKAAGRVLEIGAGTGANLPFYRDGVIELLLSEPAEPMARRLERRVAGYAIPVRVLRAPAEDIPLPELSVDVAQTKGTPAVHRARSVCRSQGRCLAGSAATSLGVARARVPDESPHARVDA